ncbi:hypothetical protein JCM3766R1_002669 [Sporobolomyces carnicolor]
MATPTTCADCLPSVSAPDHPTPVASADPLLDPSAFVPPSLSDADSTASETPRVIIEFCDRCRWLHRATWTQTELFLTFPPNLDTASTTDAPGLKAITLVPRNAPETGGRFRVWLMRPRPDSALRGWELVWDRKIEGGFPEMKALKQRIRNLIAPQQDLGHSDKPAKVA